MPSLQILAEKYCVDKLHFHSYIPFYSDLMSTRVVRRMLEIGIGYEDLMAPLVPKYIHGASLRMWSEFWPDAEIYSCDIREDTLINERRIHSYAIDQSHPVELLELVAWSGGGEWDVVIDDGSHQTAHQIVTFKTLWPYVAAGGIYVIEDVMEPDRVANAISHMATDRIARVYRFDKRCDDNLVVVWK